MLNFLTPPFALSTPRAVGRSKNIWEEGVAVLDPGPFEEGFATYNLMGRSTLPASWFQRPCTIQHMVHPDDLGPKSVSVSVKAENLLHPPTN